MNTPALADISFSVKRGETVGIIGSTGSGKTTLINLVGGFYRNYKGSTRFNEKEMKDISRDALTRKIALSPQKSVLFKGTIEENLRWGDESASEEKLNRYIDLSESREIINVKRDGLKEMIDQDGKNLSGGQRQRLCIARALIKESDVLILDDSTSALDYLTDRRLRSNLRKLEYKPTVFIVAERVSSVKDADQIIVLEDGRCIAKGRHEDLLKECPTYKEIYDTQFEEDRP